MLKRSERSTEFLLVMILRLLAKKDFGYGETPDTDKSSPPDTPDTDKSSPPDTPNTPTNTTYSGVSRGVRGVRDVWRCKGVTPYPLPLLS